MGAKISIVLIAALSVHPAWASAQSHDKSVPVRTPNASAVKPPPKSNASVQTPSQSAADHPPRIAEKNKHPSAAEKPSTAKPPAKSEEEQVIESMDFLLILEMLKDYNIVSEGN
jgi:hypothetical protein